MFAQNPNVSGANGPQFWARLSLDNDLSISALEVTQGIQNLANKMPLVGRRRTAVRAYIKSLQNAGGVQARLRGYQNGSVELPGSPLAPETEIPGQATGGTRTTLNDSFLFKLPPAWTEPGMVLLRLELNPDKLIPEISDQNNVHEVFLRFENPTAVKVTSVPFHLHPDGNSSSQPLTYTDTHSTFWPILSNLLRFHPVSSLLYWDCDVPTQTPALHSLGREWDLTTGLDQALLLTRVSLTRALNGCGDPDMHWVGLVHPDISTNTGGGSTLGIAVPFGRSSWVKMQNDTGPEWAVEGGTTLAHELGHNLGLFHANCSGDEGFPVSPFYPHPYPNCRLAAGDDGFFGLDVQHNLWGLSQPAVISNDPAAPFGKRAFPLMGYKGPNWSDPFHYCRMLLSYGIFCNPFVMAGTFPESMAAGTFASASGYGAATEPPAFSPGRAAASSFNPFPFPFPTLQEYLLVSGAFEAGTDTFAELDVLHLDDPPANALETRLDGPQESDEPEGAAGPILDVVQLANGGVLNIHSFQVDELDGQAGVHTFLETIPASSGVTGVQIRRDGKVLAQKLASAHRPSVHITFPNQGSTLFPGTNLLWTATDLDGDPMTYNVFYSPDAGETWRLLAMDLTAKGFRLPQRLPGSDAALLRVTAHDGFRTASDETDITFMVARSAPRAIILQPSGTTVGLGSTVSLTGIGTDLEQGPITEPESFVWTSDRNGILGTGQEINTRTLAKGVHQIVLSVTDEDGQVGRASSLLYVGVDPVQSFWTLWSNVDRPGGVGDFELLSNFIQRGGCPQPLAIECRTTSGKDWAEAGQTYTCKVGTGGACVNNQQPPGKNCEDYQVRFLCPHARLD